MALLLLACASPEVLLAPDDARTGLDGEDGPYGAAVVVERYAARVTDVVPTHVVYPSDGAGEPAGAGHPVMVFVQGGFVRPERYLWLAAHLASRGYVVPLPEHDLDLAITAPGNASAALDGVLGDAWLGVDPDAAPVVGGHSLGGVSGALAWQDDARFGGLFLAASYPADGARAREGSPVLALVGSADGSAPPDEVRDGVSAIDAPVGVVDGMNHYGWTDDPTEGELSRDGDAERAVEDARRDARRVLDAWLDAVVAGDVDAAAEVADGAWPGVEFQ